MKTKTRRRTEGDLGEDSLVKTKGSKSQLVKWDSFLFFSLFQLSLFSDVLMFVPRKPQAVTSEACR